MNKKFIITTGDKDGIGLEVTLKAFLALGTLRSVQFIYYKNRKTKNRLLERVKNEFQIPVYKNLDQALQSTSYIAEISSELSPATWVEEAAYACLNNQVQAMITGPLSKETIKESGLKEIGHTGILKRITKTDKLYMGFFGQHFNVALVTDHIPLNAVSGSLDQKKILDVAELIGHLNISKKPIGILGLNPHNGENGIIGTEEKVLFKDLIIKGQKRGLSLEGPLVPDAAFFQTNWKKYCCFIGLYHDQGLIPFKVIHGQNSGVHMTLGLPFIRTSVDHGTAKDIFGKNKANPNSMIEAIEMAINLARQKKR